MFFCVPFCILPNYRYITSMAFSVLMFRGLDYRTTEEQIQRRLRDLTNVPIRDVRLITDKFTNKSRGFCFVEVSSVAVSVLLINFVIMQFPHLLCYSCYFDYFHS